MEGPGRFFASTPRVPSSMTDSCAPTTADKSAYSDVSPRTATPFRWLSAANARKSVEGTPLRVQI